MYDHKVLPDMTGTRPDSTISLVRFDPVKEMDILRSVVRRDALISLLAEQRRHFMSGGALCVETVLCALLETREASLEVIDAIARWRLTLVKPEPFNVRGKNYAVEMTTDVGFLATGLTPLREAFGIELGTGNPFALPCVPSLNAVAARESGGGSGRANKGKAGKYVMTAGRDATTGKSVASGRIRVRSVRSKAEEEAAELEQKVPAVRSPATGDGKAGGAAAPDTPPPDKHISNGDTNDKTPAVSATAAVEENKTTTGVEGSGAPREEGDGVGQAEAKAEPRRSDEGGGRLKPNNSERDGGGVEGSRGGGGGGGSASMHEVLCMLGDVDDEQRARLAKAQRFLEGEVARSSIGKPREEKWWGFHRWITRPWVPSEHLPL